MLISGQEGPAAARRALAAGASGFLPKSLPLEEVAEAIRRVLGGEVFVPPEGDDPSGEASGAAPALTLRRLEVLELLGEGYSNREIARALAISERTVKAHLTAIFQILDADNRTEAVVRAQALGYLKPK
jgi:DNA-binding NarL/FixJ family response regulator